MTATRATFETLYLAHLQAKKAPRLSAELALTTALGETAHVEDLGKKFVASLGDEGAYGPMPFDAAMKLLDAIGS